MNFIVVFVFELCQVVEKEVHGGRHSLHTVFDHSKYEKKIHERRRIISEISENVDLK